MDYGNRLQESGTYNDHFCGSNNQIFGTFFFKKKVERIDWKRLASVDLDRVIQQLDFRALQDNLISVAFCDIETEFDLRSSDPNFVKIFKLSQLIIEYLLHSQDYLTNAVASIEGKYHVSIDEHELIKKKILDKQREINVLRIECHKRKKLLLAQQQILDSGPGSYQRCAYCNKAFLNASFLHAHVHRRHADVMCRDGVAAPTSARRSPEPGSNKSQRVMSRSMELEFREMMNHLRTKEGQDDLQAGRVDLTSLHNWKDELMGQHKEEMQQLRDAFQKELLGMNQRNSSLERSLREMASKMDQGRRSHIGGIEDDDDSPRRRQDRGVRFGRQRVQTINESHDAELKKKDAEIARLKALDRSQRPKKTVDIDEGNQTETYPDPEKVLPSLSQLMVMKFDEQKSMITNFTSSLLKSHLEEQRKGQANIANYLGHQIQGLLHISNRDVGKDLPKITKSGSPRLEFASLEEEEGEGEETSIETEMGDIKEDTEEELTPRHPNVLCMKTSVNSITISKTLEYSETAKLPPTPPIKCSGKGQALQQNQNESIPQRSAGLSSAPQGRSVQIKEDEIPQPIRRNVGQLQKEAPLRTRDSDDDLSEMSAALGNVLKGNEFSPNASMEYSLVRCSHLLEQLRSDPDVLHGLKDELAKLLEEQLLERGIPAGTRRITNPVLNDKLALLRKERDQLSRKHINFAAIRQALAKKVDKKARETFFGRNHRHNDESPVLDHASLSQTPTPGRKHQHQPPRGQQRGDRPHNGMSPARNQPMYNSMPSRGRQGPTPPKRYDMANDSESETEEETEDSRGPTMQIRSPKTRNGLTSNESSPGRTGAALPSPRKPRQTPSTSTVSQVSPNAHHYGTTGAGVDYTDGGGTGEIKAPAQLKQDDEIEMDISEILDQFDSPTRTQVDNSPEKQQRSAPARDLVIEQSDDDIDVSSISQIEPLAGPDQGVVSRNAPVLKGTTGSSDYSYTSQWGTNSRMGNNQLGTGKSSEFDSN